MIKELRATQKRTNEQCRYNTRVLASTCPTLQSFWHWCAPGAQFRAMEKAVVQKHPNWMPLMWLAPNIFENCLTGTFPHASTVTLTPFLI